MRLDDAGPRTRLLAVLAGAGLLVWMVTLAGVGGRVELLPGDPALLPALPDPGMEQAQALEPLAAYSVIAERPLFSTERTPRPFFLSGPEAEAGGNGFDYQLTSVLLTPALRMAILTPTGGGDAVRVREGAEPPGAPGWQLVALERRSAVFDGPDGRVALGLRVFDGTGGTAPPTPVAGSTEAGGADALSAAGDAPAAADGVPGTPPEVGDASGLADQAATTATAAADTPQPDPAQLDAIRERIQARRARQQRQDGQ